MPGIDGYEVCRSLKKDPDTRTIPVIIVTSSPDVSLDHLAYAAGAVACIRKPFRREALVAMINVALKNPGASTNLTGR
jgi:CheY-like chemotaxis protein